eukprot:SAG11_NODE_7854_length_1088_cov_0.972700_2_plen_98_part_00
MATQYINHYNHLDTSSSNFQKIDSHSEAINVGHGAAVAGLIADGSRRIVNIDGCGVASTTDVKDAVRRAFEANAMVCTDHVAGQRTFAFRFRLLVCG